MYARRFALIVFGLLLVVPSLKAGVCPCNADVDNNGLIQVQDWACIQDCKGGNCGCCVNSCDINCDGVVDDADGGDDIFNEISAFRCRFIGMPTSSCCGACCDETGGVCTDDLWLSLCTGGDVWTSGFRCAEVACDPEPTGACCDLDFGTCENGVTEPSCVGANISWTEGQSCTPATCPAPPVGACCDVAFGTCQSDVPQAGCVGANETWTEGQACSPALCPVPPTGACCNTGNGSCEDDILAVDCGGAQHVWTASMTCASVSCAVPPQDPCPCNADVDNNGLVQVQDWICIQDCKGGNCSCCVNSCDVNCDGVVNDADAGNDILTEVSALRCRFIGNSASSCCGACCDQNSGICTDNSWQSLCDGGADVWTSLVRCADVPCDPDPTGACCDVEFGTCENDVAEASCTGGNVAWTEGQACSPAICPAPPTGACCNLASGICTEGVVAANCIGATRVWSEGATCSQAGCSVPPQEPCPCNAEVNGSNPLNILDVLAILDCANDDCDQCVGICDTNCSGRVDYVDMGIAACQFRGRSNCCSEPSGACLGAQGLPSCSNTTFDGCDLLQGRYVGDGTLCQNGILVPATSTWGLMILTLLVATAATLFLLAGRHWMKSPEG